MKKKLWTCPRCGVKLVQKNLSHSCGAFSIERFLEGKPRDLFDRFVAIIAACGPYDVAPAKTRVAFLVRVRFASVNRVSKDSIDILLVLPRKIASKRFRKFEKLGKLYVHHLRLQEGDFDDESCAVLMSSPPYTPSLIAIARRYIGSARA